MRTLRKLFAVLLALGLATSPALAASIPVVTNQAADVHRSAFADSEAVPVQEGLEMKLTGYGNGWGRVSLNDHTGYVQLKYLNLEAPAAAWLSKDTELYAEAGSASLGTLDQGTEVIFLGVDGDYARVTDSASAFYGFVELGALTSRESGSSLLATEAGASQSKVERVIYTAQQLLGKPYMLMANPPSSFNCASFVKYCYSSAVNGCLGDTLSEQVHDVRYATIWDIDDLRRGDMLCFNFSSDTDPVGHVGIYIGDGWFIHASSSDGEVVVSRLTSGGYARSFSWGKRIFEE